VTYGLTDSAGGRFVINPSTGVVTVGNSALLDGPASHTITVQADDGHGGTSTQSFTIAVTNVAPTATFTAPSSGTEGSTYTLALSGTDAGTADRASLQYAFDCGQGAGYTAFGTAKSVTCAALPDQRALTVRGQVRDKNGATAAYTRSLTLANDAPVVRFAATSATTLSAGGTFRAQGSFTDRGAGDAPWSYTVVWGDGTANSTGSTTAQGTLPALSHVYTRTGSWSARLTVRDKDGASTTSAAVSVRVGHVPPSALQVRGYKVKGVHHAQLAWTRGSAPTVDVWRNGTRVRSAVTNSGSLTDDIGSKGGASYTYRVCVAGLTAASSCSNSVTVTF
jgi:hypothetical protein